MCCNAEEESRIKYLGFCFAISAATLQAAIALDQRGGLMNAGACKKLRGLLEAYWKDDIFGLKCSYEFLILAKACKLERDEAREIQRQLEGRIEPDVYERLRGMYDQAVALDRFGDAAIRASHARQFLEAVEAMRGKTMKYELTPQGWQVSLKDCPPGPFAKVDPDGSMSFGFKTEYVSDHSKDGLEVFVLSTGESWQGDQSTGSPPRADQLVWPCQPVAIPEDDA